MRSIVEAGPFFGMDGAPDGPYMVNTGSGFGAEAGCPLLRELMKPYEAWDKDSFLDERGFSTLPSCPPFNWPIFSAFGVKGSDELQKIKGITFYPCRYFSPMNTKTREIMISPETYSIHHYSWGSQPKIDRWVNDYRAKLARKNGGVDYPYSKFRVRFYLLHPFKAWQYHFLHRKRKTK